MARNGSGTHTVPNSFTAGAVITASDHNENWSDVSSEITNSVAADGQTTMTGPLKASNGSAAAPSLAFGSDPDTGTYRRGGNELGFSTGGIASGYFDSAQKLWLLGAFDVVGAANFQGAVSFAGGGGFGTGTFSGAATFSGDLTLSGANTFSGINTFSSTSHLKLPTGTTAQAPVAGTFGRIRGDTTLTRMTFDDGTAHRAVVVQTDAASTSEVTSETTGKFIEADRLKYSPRVSAAGAYLSAAGALQSGVGVTNATASGGGVYTVNLSVTMANTNYRVHITPFGTTGGGVIPIVTSKTTTTIGITFLSTAATGSNPTTGFDIEVIGELA